MKLEIYYWHKQILSEDINLLLIFVWFYWTRSFARYTSANSLRDFPLTCSFSNHRCLFIRYCVDLKQEWWMFNKFLWPPKIVSFFFYGMPIYLVQTKCKVLVSNASRMSNHFPFFLANDSSFFMLHWYGV